MFYNTLATPVNVLYPKPNLESNCMNLIVFHAVVIQAEPDSL